MKEVNLSKSSFKSPLISSGSKLSITTIIVLMVISSPIFIFTGPIQVSAATPAAGNPNGIDTSAYHSNMPVSSSSSAPTSTMNQGGDFTTQAALSLTRASQTSNFVSSKAYYDISFRTATAGVIKTIEMDFPVGTYVGAAVLVEADGIGPGTIAASGSTGAGMKITYTVTNAVNVPALTKIRIEISNINNPPDPSASLTVGITTKNAANAIIDGPTPTTAYNMVQVGETQIADGAITLSKPAEGFMKKVTLFDESAGHAAGWDPNGVATAFEIIEPLAGEPSSAGSSAIVNVDNFFSADPVCSASQVFLGEIEVWCTSPPADGSTLDYTIINLPPHT